MRTIALSVLMTVCAVGAAHAQEAPTNMPPPLAPSEFRYESQHNPVNWDYWPPTSQSGIGHGVDALMNKDFARAEDIFARYLRRKPTHGEANLYMGVAQMNLGKWESAKTHLKVAARKKPNHPDPKSRLGVAYAMLGDTAGAIAQRAELERMADACKDACRLAGDIDNGIEMIDEALAEAPAGPVSG